LSYLVLARKLRPLTFDEVVAQRHITDTLKKAVSSGRIAHAYLFCGTRGTGKTTTARILAKALNCIEGPTAEPCLKCVNCTEIASSSSMDVLEIDAASNTGVDSIRELRENVRYAPAGSKYKIYIIDEVHRLSGSAFDALLKTLEEPPSHVIFIFATTDPHALPATILSRTQRYDFRRIPLKDMLNTLKGVVAGEGLRITDDAVALIARKGDGSLRDALSITEQVLAYSDGEITVGLIADALGLVDLNLLLDLTEALHKRDSVAVLDFVAKLNESGADISQFLIDFQMHLRNMLIVKTAEDPSRLVEVSDMYMQRYLEQREFFSESDIFRMVQAVSDLRQQLKDGADPRLFLEITLVKLAKMDTTATLSDVLTKLQSLSGKSTNNPSGSALPGRSDLFSNKGDRSSKGTSEANRPEEPGNSADSPSEPSWDSFLDGYTETNGFLSVLLRSGRPEFISDNELRLAFSPDSGAKTVITSEKIRQIESAMLAHFGRHIKLRIEIDDSVTSKGVKSTLDPRFDISPQDLFEKNPEIKKIVDKYDGKVLSIKKSGDKGVNDG
jgi:DNA polymerase-3 subunit gamma/tau